MMKIIELCHLPPSKEPESHVSLPLTFFDVIWLRFHPVERLFFYETPQFAFSDVFFNSVLPNLKASLSATLSHFLPLAGNFLWPPHSAKPFLHYSPGDAVSFTVAEFNDVTAFDRLAGDAPRPAEESRPLVPQLNVSDSKASAMAVQVTFFPKKGVCIGLTCHHAALDGQASTMFMKAWAHICRNSATVALPPELTPVFDRDCIKVPTGIDMVFLNSDWVRKANKDPNNPKNLKLSDDINFQEDRLRATVKLTQEDINKLKNKLSSSSSASASKTDNNQTQRYFSTFVTTCAYVLDSMIKAGKKRTGTVKKAFFGFPANYRSRLNPPVTKNYVGNCAGKGVTMIVEGKDFGEKELPVSLAVKMSDEIKKLENKENILEGAEGWCDGYIDLMKAGEISRIIGVAGSPLFRVYETDFGWGKPKKVEVASIDRGESISMAENGDDGNGGGVEVGLVLKKDEMEMFSTLFSQHLDKNN